MDYYKYRGFEKRLFEEKDPFQTTFDDLPKGRRTPSNIPEKPSGTRKVIPFPKRSNAPIPKVETRSPRDFSPKVPFSKIFGNPILNFLLQPSQTASPYEDEYNWADHGEMISRHIAQDNFVGRDLAVRKQKLESFEVDFPTKPVDNPNFVRPAVPTIQWNTRPENKPFFSRSPKKGTIEIGIPDYDVPPPIPIELPEFHPWFDEPTPSEVPGLLKEFDYEVQPMYDPNTISVRRPDNLREKGVSIEISSGTTPRIAIRPVSIRAATKRKNDVKAASRWIKLAQLGISLTYGTYTEIMDFTEILVWDAYRVDPRTGKLIYAMFEEDYKMINVINGIAEGKYDVDIAATLVDYGVSQAQDILIGQASRKVTREVIDTGNWRSPQGPQGFINKMNKDYRNVLSQYETKSANEQERRLFSLPPLSEQPRRLWNAKSGLSPSVRS